ncbi:MAG: hypothetical protein WBV25_00855, partial [Methylocella sp.]
MTPARKLCLVCARKTATETTIDSMGTAHGLSVLFRRMILADHASRYFLPFGGALAAAAGAAGAAFPALA